MEIFRELERLLSNLYPYRWPLTAIAGAAFIVALVYAYKHNLHLTLWRHKLSVMLIAVPLLAAALPVSIYTLSPLFERTHLNQESPLVLASPVNTEVGEIVIMELSGTSAATSFPRIVGKGEFLGADDFHFGHGQALIIEIEPGRYTLRFENFSVRNGPDLYVYLSHEADDYGKDPLEIGKLKATDGAFNYEIPSDTDITQYKSAIVWCKPFGVMFAIATLTS